MRTELRIRGAGAGYLVIKRSGQLRFEPSYGDHQRMVDTYFTTYPGYYFTGDGALRDEDGYLRITGRVMTMSQCFWSSHGHCRGGERSGTARGHRRSSRRWVPHDIKGQGIYAYVTPMSGVEDSEALRTELIALCVKEIGPIAKPDKIQWAPGLPKTRSGKIMRRILRKIAERRPRKSW